ncbi:hypothetical protein IKQ26_09485 [bacterium]|nr:hypothetical protein [bacterium]
MKIARVNNNFSNTNHKNNNSNQSFKGVVDSGINAFIKMQESTAAARFFQDTATNWAPKAVFTRSPVDLAEMSFMEFLESAIFYGAPAIVGEHVMRNGLMKKVLPKELNKHVSKTVGEILSNDALVSSGAAKKIIPAKAGILLGCMAIPAMEYALSFAKNLFTLKVFKTSNFDKIANLDKNAKNVKQLTPEEIKHQQKVKSSAIKHIVGAGIVSAAAITGGLLLAKKAPDSAKLQKLSEVILEPGKHLAEKFHTKPKMTRFLNEFFNLDLAKKGSETLGLSKGMLGATVSIGILGYLGAAKDRSDLDFKEVLTRTPISGAYAIFGSDLLEDVFMNKLSKSKKFMEKFPDLIKQTKDGLFEVPTKVELDKQLADGIIDKAAHANKMRGKAIISGVPFAFSMIVMGFAIAGMSRFWTQYRYNKLHQAELKAEADKNGGKLPKDRFVKVFSFGDKKKADKTFSSMKIVSSKLDNKQDKSFVKVTSFGNTKTNPFTSKTFVTSNSVDEKFIRVNTFGYPKQTPFTTRTVVTSK